MNYSKTLVLGMLLVLILGLAASCSKPQQTQQKPVPPPEAAGTPTEEQPSAAENTQPQAAAGENKETTQTTNQEGKTYIEGAKVPVSNKPAATKNWLTTEMTDTAGQTFTINQYKGKTVLIQSFSTTCERCKEQMQYLKAFKQMSGENVILVSIDTDLNENPETVKEFAATNEFIWHVVPSSIDATTAMLKKFGTKMLKQENLPMAMWCDNLRTKTFNGMKTAEQLQQELTQGCT
ncbi:TlpA family protein disulfide reductase [Candidatus Woesearchaeota archaeon]|nr:TlpA family protein disulfide reductase [Candidatus Woesearchaeota archaeon]